MVPPQPPEDARVVVDDGLQPPLRSLRPQVTLSRRELSRQAGLDLDTVLDRALVPGFVWLPQSAARAVPTVRGHRDDVAFVVDGVPLIAGAFTEELGLFAPAQLTLSTGARARTPLPARGGVVEVDTGGDLDDVGESARVDGVMGVGYGGPDVEKGVFALGRTGWHRLRLQSHATLLQREDFRVGRVGLGVPAGVAPVDDESVVIVGSGGVGGTVGARVDVVPVDDARLFVRAGRPQPRRRRPRLLRRR